MSPHRPNKQFCYWNKEQAYSLLEAAAAKALHRSGRHRNYIEVGDLISEGWLRSLRFVRSDEELKWQPLHLLYAMIRAANRLENPHVESKHKVTFQQYPEVPFDSMNDISSDEFELAEEVLICCKTQRERDMFIARLRGYTDREIAKQFGCSYEWVRQVLFRVRDRFVARTKKQQRNVFYG